MKAFLDNVEYFKDMAYHIIDCIGNFVEGFPTKEGNE